MLQDTLRDVLGGTTADPLPARLQAVAAKGRVGAMVTRLEISPDFESVTVESALYVRTANGGWTRGPWRAGTIRTGDVAPGAAEAVADDPQVKAAFGMIDSIAPGMVTPADEAQGPRRRGHDQAGPRPRPLGPQPRPLRPGPAARRRRRQEGCTEAVRPADLRGSAWPEPYGEAHGPGRD